MKKIMSFLVFMIATTFLFGQDIVGDWHGMLEVQGMKLRIVFHIQKSDDGYTATLDSPDQNATGIPVGEVQYADSELFLNMPNLMAEYKGKLLADQNEIEGTFTQAGRALDLKLQREAIEKEVLVRPQEPKEPYPYQIEDVSYENEDAGNSLAGTLTLPKEGNKHPVVILISGSGPQNRDEELLGHKPFWIIADYLTRQGIGVLRFDDRGVGQSTGDFGPATSEDFASDVLAGVAYLKSRQDIDHDNIGLAGHSEGGLIAPMVAAKSKDVDFIVLLAGPGVPGDKIIYRQQKLINKAEGGPKNAYKQNLRLMKAAFKMMQEEEDMNTVREKLKPVIIDILSEVPELKDNDIDELAEQQLFPLLTPWFRYFISYDPATSLKKVQCPVLALNGEKDLQVDPKQNLRPIKAALKKAGNKNFIVKELPNLNHLFQTSETGKPSEYGELEETFSPIALKAMSDWILKVIGQ